MPLVEWFLVLVAPMTSNAAHTEQPRLNSEEIKAYQIQEKNYIREKFKSTSKQRAYWHNWQTQMQQHQNTLKTCERRKIGNFGYGNISSQRQILDQEGVWDNKTDTHFTSQWKSRVQMKCKQSWNGTLQFFYNLLSLEGSKLSF